MDLSANLASDPTRSDCSGSCIRPLSRAQTERSQVILAVCFVLIKQSNSPRFHQFSIYSLLYAVQNSRHAQSSCVSRSDNSDTSSFAPFSEPTWYSTIGAVTLPCESANFPYDPPHILYCKSQPLFQKYESILPTSLTHIVLIDQRLLTLETCCGFRYGHTHEQICWCFKYTVESCPPSKDSAMLPIMYPLR
jgi:hypothetical protein